MSMHEPLAWVGSPSLGGLRLPSAKLSPSSLYAPRGVWTDGKMLVVADTGNHRVMIWNELPRYDQAPADIVLGQPDFLSEGPNTNGFEYGMNLPTGVCYEDGRLIVADAWNHRLLVWDKLPDHNCARADHVIGQQDLFSVEVNAGQSCGPTSLYWPFGIGFVGGRFWITDTGNRRALAFEHLPLHGEKPDLILGQSDGYQNEENRGGLTENSFRWVHAVAGDDDYVFLADAGNHRVLVWPSDVRYDSVPLAAVGQIDLLSAYEFSLGPQNAKMLRFPYSVTCDKKRLAVADTANNRILIYDNYPLECGLPADSVIGQIDLVSNGENRWQSVTHETLCWPYGICMSGEILAVADSGNNRVMLWRLS